VLQSVCTYRSAEVRIALEADSGDAQISASLYFMMVLYKLRQYTVLQLQYYRGSSAGGGDTSEQSGDSVGAGAQKDSFA